MYGFNLLETAPRLLEELKTLESFGGPAARLLEDATISPKFGWTPVADIVKSLVRPVDELMHEGRSLTNYIGTQANSVEMLDQVGIRALKTKTLDLPPVSISRSTQLPDRIDALLSSESGMISTRKPGGVQFSAVHMHSVADVTDDPNKLIRELLRVDPNVSVAYRENTISSLSLSKNGRRVLGEQGYRWLSTNGKGSIHAAINFDLPFQRDSLIFADGLDNALHEQHSVDSVIAPVELDRLIGVNKESVNIAINGEALRNGRLDSWDLREITNQVMRNKPGGVTRL
ncbi:MAG TPA: hypothetical protein V6C81_08330 [Planktothrix sp.]|jgi:hypothetical protein